MGAFFNSNTNHNPPGKSSPSSNGLFFQCKFSEKSKKRVTAKIKTETTTYYAKPGYVDSIACSGFFETLYTNRHE